MARPLRLQYPGALYHITARGNERKAIYRSDSDRREFLAHLAHAIDRYRLILHAYVLMDNHYHLLLETREANLSLALRHLNGQYTMSFNRRHRRVGHLFQGRFKAIVVEKESYLLELSRYIHLNPIRARMKVRLGSYPWSSYLAYVGRRRAADWLTREQVLASFGGSRPSAQEAYRKFVEEGIKGVVEAPWGKVFAQVGLGGPEFLRRLQRSVQGAGNREVPSRRKLETRPSWPVIEKAVGGAVPELNGLRTGRRSNPQKAVLFYLGRERGGLSLKDLAVRFGVEESTVSRAAGNVGRLRAEDARWDRVIRGVEKSIESNI
jgi:putative transposase